MKTVLGPFFGLLMLTGCAATKSFMVALVTPPPPAPPTPPPSATLTYKLPQAQLKLDGKGRESVQKDQVEISLRARDIGFTPKIAVVDSATSGDCQHYCYLYRESIPYFVRDNALATK